MLRQEVLDRDETGMVFNVKIATITSTTTSSTSQQIFGTSTNQRIFHVTRNQRGHNSHGVNPQEAFEQGVNPNMERGDEGCLLVSIQNPTREPKAKYQTFEHNSELLCVVADSGRQQCTVVFGQGVFKRTAVTSSCEQGGVQHIT